MKIGVISDTHIPDKAKEIPAQILNEFKNVDMIIHAGDFVDLTVLDELKSVCKNVIAVAGNMDTEEIKGIFPQKKIIIAGKYRIGVMHGCGAPGGLINFLLLAFKDENVDIIIHGHSHNVLNERKNGILFFNPGSPTDKIFSNYNSYGIIEINDKIDARIIKI